MIRPGNSSSIIARTLRRNACVSGRFSQLVPSASNRYGTASSRNPSTPMPSQNRPTSIIASTTRGFSKFRSGWWPKNRCQKYWRRTGSNVQLDVSVSTKMIRASW